MFVSSCKERGATQLNLEVGVTGQRRKQKVIAFQNMRSLERGKLLSSSTTVDNCVAQALPKII